MSGLNGRTFSSNFPQNSISMLLIVEISHLLIVVHITRDIGGANINSSYEYTRVQSKLRID